MVKSGKTKFQRNLLEAGNEKDIEHLWREEFKRINPKIKISSPHNTDGILTFNNIHTLLEFKDKKGFKNKRVRCSVIMQALYYLHNIEVAGDRLPSTIFIGDGSECFALRTNVLSIYLNRHDIDWSIAPSQSSLHNPKMLDEMDKSKDMDNVLVIDVQSDTFRLDDILPILDEFSKSIGSKIKIDETNLLSAFNYFKDNVLKSKQSTLQLDDTKKRVNRQIDVFYNCLTDKTTTMPNKKGDIVTHGEVFEVNKQQYDAFFNLFEQETCISEREKLVSIKDRIVEEITRRMTGAYFTPNLWIDKAHEMVSEQFGVDWKEKYVVWDCASGTNNLTRGYKFKELYNSTLEQGDVDTVNDMGYGGATFQYDFLNDDESKLPVGLKKALVEKKPLLFLINPPYGTAGGSTIGKGDNKAGVASTLMGNSMRDGGMGLSSAQLYAQFLYGIILLKEKYKHKDVNLCLFSSPLFMSGEGYTEFRKLLYSHFNFKAGMLFQANQFADVSGGWGISFTMWGGK